jgi:hypothetical protein
MKPLPARAASRNMRVTDSSRFFSPRLTYAFLLAA